ncbi:GNAT family N-acetyltransferase [Treponema putidum]|uniref:GNAT family N-acetyltransferase n=1 Tax=Treponema putidum TaxID=221027 RepID=UPI003D92AB90
MNMVYTFQSAHSAEVEAVFALYEKRIRWMDEVGIRHWNVWDYLTVYPVAYYVTQQTTGNLYALKDNSCIIGAVVLLEHDNRWTDKADDHAYYIHNLVTDPVVKGAGKIILAEIEKLAICRKKGFLRLDCDSGSTFLNNYYGAKGFVLSGHCKDGAYTGNRREKTLQRT